MVSLEIRGLCSIREPKSEKISTLCSPGGSVEHEPHRVENIPCVAYSKQFIGLRNRVQVGAFP